MGNTTQKLTRELNLLLRLTKAEATIATVRQAQARDAGTQRELADNAKDAQQRADQIRSTISKLGGVPDALGVALGRFGAFAKTQVEQGQTFTDALLGDLQLEHQLRDRAQLVRMLADAAGKREVVRLAERLERSHTETIEWIRTRLAEVAVGGPVALRPTPIQVGVGAVRRFASFPVQQTAKGLNRSFTAFGNLTNRAEKTLETNVEKAVQLKDAAEEILGAGRDAALERTEEVARSEGAGRTAKAVRKTRRATGTLNNDELPIRNYDSLSADRAADRINKLDDASDVRAIRAYEEQNKARKTVIKAADDQLTAIADAVRKGESLAANSREEIIDLTVEELRVRASDAYITGRSSMSKYELVKALTK